MDKDKNFACTSDWPDLASSSTENSLSARSKEQYNKTYASFISWQQQSHTNSLSENVLLAYFTTLAKTMKPSTLWATYSKLRGTIELKNNVDISNYDKLRAYLKNQSVGFTPKKSKILSDEHIKQFLLYAPDYKFLFTKVALIFGIMGACHREELQSIETHHVKDDNSTLLIQIPNTATTTERQFVVGGEFYQTCKKYMELRPPDINCSRFFLNYYNGKCISQPTGINKFGNLSRVVAEFLKLPEPKSYTGRHGGWKSTTFAETCSDHSLSKKIHAANLIMKHIESTTSEDATNNDIAISTPIRTKVTEVTTSGTTINHNDHIFKNNIKNYSTNAGPVTISYANCNNASNISFNIHIRK